MRWGEGWEWGWGWGEGGMRMRWGWGKGENEGEGEGEGEVSVILTCNELSTNFLIKTIFVSRPSLAVLFPPWWLLWGNIELTLFFKYTYKY